MVAIIILGCLAAFLLFGSYGLFTHARSSSREVRASKHWPMTMGRMLEATKHQSVDRSPGEAPNVSYLVSVRYEYTVDGVRHESSNLDFTTAMRLTEGQAIALLEKYRPGKLVAVFYDPKDPRQAALVQEARGNPLVYVYAVLMLLGGLGALGLGLALLLGFSLPQVDARPPEPDYPDRLYVKQKPYKP